jgi:hypothetical protein
VQWVRCHRNLADSGDLFPRTTCRLSISEHLMPNHVGCDDVIDFRQSPSTEPSQRFSRRIF